LSPFFAFGQLVNEITGLFVHVWTSTGRATEAGVLASLGKFPEENRKDANTALLASLAVQKMRSLSALARSTPVLADKERIVCAVSWISSGPADIVSYKHRFSDNWHCS
jgi:hypothetical protein